jgi:hypothetical protein
MLSFNVFVCHNCVTIRVLRPFLRVLHFTLLEASSFTLYMYISFFKERKNTTGYMNNWKLSTYSHLRNYLKELKNHDWPLLPSLPPSANIIRMSTRVQWFWLFSHFSHCPHLYLLVISSLCVAGRCLPTLGKVGGANNVQGVTWAWFFFRNHTPCKGA